MSVKKGKVILIGAGPGDKGLITVKGLEYLKQAEVVVYDRLVSQDILSLSPENAELINVGKVMNHHNIPQDEINKILLSKALEGKNVVRLKGGDPFVFGRGGEELELLKENNIDFEIIPGITSAVSALAYAGIPVTHRDFTSSIHFITGHAKDGSVENIDFKSLVNMNGTILFYMGVSTLNQLADGLLKAGMDKDMPCCAVENGTRFNMRTMVSTLSNVVEDAQKFNLRSPAVIAFGKVCSLADKFKWFTETKVFSKKIIALRHYLSKNILADKLKNLGAEVIDYPCYKSDEMQDKSLIENAVRNLDKYNTLIFTSKYSVDNFFKVLINLGKDSRVLFNKTICSMGRITSDELKNHGIISDVVSKDYTNESMLLELQNKDLTGKILVLESDNLQDSLADLLKNSSYNAEHVGTFKVEYLPFDYKLSLDESIESGVITAFTSSSVVDGFVKGNNIKDLSKVVGVCIGEQTYKTALSYGMNVVKAEKATIDSLIEKIEEMG